MKYLTTDDLTGDAYQRFITESSGDGAGVLDKCEERAIALAVSYLNSRYAVTDIFGDPVLSVSPLHDELLAEIITKTTLCRLFRRNAARKLPDDIKEGFDWALAMLEKIQTGRVKLDLPPALDDAGNPKSFTMWGNNTNPDYYI